MVDWFLSLPLWVYLALMAVEVLGIVVLERRVRRVIRHRRVRRERDAPDLRAGAPPLMVPDRRRPNPPLRAVPALRPGEPRDSDLARAFRIRLEERGCYVDELMIRKLN